MPLVLVTGAPTASGHRYDDVFGKQYEFPAQYRNLVVPGESFVYYTGRRGGLAVGPSYTGCGVIGDVRPSSSSGKLVAAVHDVRLFERPLVAKRSDGTYLETGSTKGTNWTSGVRRVSETTFRRLVAPAELGPTNDARVSGKRETRASLEHASRLERYSVAVALDLLRQTYGPPAVQEMPPGNPGFDILVALPGRDLHVEVKGTVLPEPVFHLSEGQRRHAELRRSDFLLVVVYGVDIHRGRHDVALVEGPLSEDRVGLQPAAWTGVVLV